LRSFALELVSSSYARGSATDLKEPNKPSLPKLLGFIQTSLWLYHTGITDAGLEKLKGLKALNTTAQVVNMGCLGSHIL